MRIRYLPLLLLSTWAIPGIVWASSLVTSSQFASWQNPEILPVPTSTITRFAGLAPGQARFYRLTTTQPRTLTVVVSVPVKAAERFLPSLVVYQPELQTTGPSLPMEQPPNTLASVYPGVAGRAVWHWKTQTSSRTILSTQVTLNLAGDHYLAVYNPSPASGVYQLKVAGSKTPSLESPLDYPVLWWYTQVWAGWGLASLLFPLAIVLAGGLLWLIGRMLYLRYRAAKL